MSLIQIHSELKTVEKRMIFCLGALAGIGISFVIMVATYFFIF